jgi:hypothetical protein
MRITKGTRTRLDRLEQRLKPCRACALWEPFVCVQDPRAKPPLSPARCPECGRLRPTRLVIVGVNCDRI